MSVLERSTFLSIWWRDVADGCCCERMLRGGEELLLLFGSFIYYCKRAAGHVITSLFSPSFYNNEFYFLLTMNRYHRSYAHGEQRCQFTQILVMMNV